jgi:lysozyme
MIEFNYDLDQILLDEGFREKPYRCTEDYLTVGHGINLDAGITEEESKLIVLHRLKKLDVSLQRNLDWYKTAPSELQNVLCSMGYQLGVSGLLKFKKALAAMEAKDYETAAAELLDSRWSRQTSLRAHRLADRVREL